MPVRPRILVASIGLVMLAACSGGDGPAPDEPPGAARPTTAPRAVPMLLDSHCPPRSTSPAYPADGVVPSGAIAVRLCNGARQEPAPGIRALDVPEQLLTERIEELVDAVNGLEPMADGEFCAGTGGLDYVLWFLYPGGDARAVTSNTGTGCPGAFVTPDRELFGADLLEVYGRLVHAQREDRIPPGAAAAADCNPIDAPISPLRLDRTLHFASATYCTLTRGTVADRWRSAVVPPRLVDRLNADLASSEGRATPPCSRGLAWLVGYTAWGDRIQIPGQCGVYGLTEPESWRLSTPVARALDSLALSTPYPQCSTSERGRCPAP